MSPLIKRFLLSMLAVLCLPSVAAARQITYRGLRVTVPRGWSVYDLGRHPHTCVRFNRHALYLGRPGAAEDCPPQAAGRTEAILVEPPAGARMSGFDSGHVAELALHGMWVTVTWGRHRSIVERALGVRSLAPGRLAFAAAAARTRSGGGGVAASPPPGTTAATPGQVFTGSGFDACSAPSSSTMSAWRSASPYGAIGVYIGGANMACSQSNLTSTWVGAQSAAGWHLIPIYVGLQAPGNGCGCAALSSSATTAAQQGAAAATDAITQAQAVGLGPGNPIYFDMEAYTQTQSTTAAVLSFLAAWTQGLHAAGYLSGVYSSDGSGIADLVSRYGTSYTEPDEIWFASWNGSATTSDSVIPSTEWTTHQRLHQYSGARDVTYGGAKLNVDDDYLDAPTAAYGSSATATAGGGTSTTPTSTTPTPTTTTPTPTTTTPTPPALAAAGNLWLFTAFGNVYAAPGTTWFGSPAASRQHQRSVSGMAPTPDGQGYWLVTTAGQLFAYGDATPIAAIHPAHPAVGVVAAPDGGVWLFTAHGNVYNLGGATFFGSPAAHRVRLSNIAGMAVTADGQGYWLITTTGTLLPYGDATALPAFHPAHPVRGILAAPGGGLWAYTAYGNVYNLGGAPWYGSHRTRTAQLAGLTATADGAGYWLVGTTGTAFPFGDATPVQPIRPAHPLLGSAG